MLSADELKMQLRQKMRLYRKDISKQCVQTQSQHIIQQIVQSPDYLNSQHIAGYLAQDGEPSLNTLFEHSWSQGKSTYLPVIRPLPPNRLWFVAYHQTTQLQKNRFSIHEPQKVVGNILPLSHLDIIFVPLVAFDENCHRLGMGGGFYDRSLSYLKKSSHCPKLIGIAYDEQKIDKVPIESWDIALDAVITPKYCYKKT